MDVGHQTDSPIAAFFREHVLSPLTAAEAAVANERGAVEAEQRAFARFNERIARIETEPVSQSAPATQTYRVAERSRGDERAHAAFRETVMSVDHYEEVYDETLEEHARAELSADVAAGLRRESSTEFSEWYKSTLTAAVERAIGKRKRFCAQLATEARSLEASSEALAAIIDACDGPRVPPWYRADFEDQLGEIARERQEVIQQRPSLSRIDGHDLCRYLYNDQQWTYPALTAVARLRDVVV